MRTCPQADTSGEGGNRRSGSRLVADSGGCSSGVLGPSLTQYAGEVHRSRCVGGQRGPVAGVGDGTAVDGEAAAADAGVESVTQLLQGLDLLVQADSPVL